MCYRIMPDRDAGYNAGRGDRGRSRGTSGERRRRPEEHHLDCPDMALANEERPCMGSECGI